jgi:hypothetical protein
MNRDRRQSPRMSLRIVAAGLAVALAAALMFVVLGAYGSRAGYWGARQFQVQNLAGRTVAVTATLYHWDGSSEPAMRFSLPPTGTLYVPSPPFNVVTTGTLYFDSDGPIAAAIAHLEDGQLEIGNEVYETGAGEQITKTNSLMADLERNVSAATSSVVVVSKPPTDGGGYTYTLMLYNLDGTPVVTETWYVSDPRPRMWQLNLGLENRLPPLWQGSGHLRVEGLPGPSPLVQVWRGGLNDYDAYRGGMESGVELIVPWALPENVAGGLHSKLRVFNPNTTAVPIVVEFEGQPPVTASLSPHQLVVIPVPGALNAGVSIRIRSLNDLPIAAGMHTLGLTPAPLGRMSYPAIATGDLRRHAAVPLVYHNYLAWTHLPPYGTLEILNASNITATVEATYRAATLGLEPAAGPESVTVVFQLGPWQHRNLLTVQAPPPGTTNWSLFVRSTQRTAVLAVGFRQTTTLDHWFAYRGQPYLAESQTTYIPLMSFNRVNLFERPGR